MQGKKTTPNTATPNTAIQNTAMIELIRVKIAELGQKLAPRPSSPSGVAVTIGKGAVPASSESEAIPTSTRPAQRNVVLPCFSQAGRERVFAELNLFFEVNPSRFFLLDLRREYQELSVSIGEPVGDSAGSQVVVFEGAPNHLPEICGLIRSHVLVGVHTELALFDGALLPEALSALLSLSDSVLIESNLFDHLGGSGWGDGRAALFAEILAANVSIIDSSWLRLSSLREELRRAYDQRGLLGVQGLEIQYTVARNSTAKESHSSSISNSDSLHGLPTVAVLMAGWCCSRLGAHSLSPALAGAFAEFEDGQRIPLKFSRVPNSANPSGTKVEGLNLEKNDAGVCGLVMPCTNGIIRIEIIAAEAANNNISKSGAFLLRTEVDTEIKTRSERVFEQEADTDRWRRYFRIGESVTNYRSSLRLALALFR